MFPFVNCTRMNRTLFKYFDLAYFIRFALILLGLYYFNIFYIGLTVPGGVYSSFLDQYLNYIVWLRNSILHTANVITQGFGLSSYVADLYTLKTEAFSVVLVYSCLGLGIKSFWIAFVTAHKAGWQKKLAWCLAGVMAIWFINCWRAALLLMAMKNHWSINKYMDHHTLFNLCAYALILFLMYLYTRKRKPTDTFPHVVPA